MINTPIGYKFGALGEVEGRSGMREVRGPISPDYASLNPGCVGLPVV